MCRYQIVCLPPTNMTKWLEGGSEHVSKNLPYSKVKKLMRVVLSFYCEITEIFVDNIEGNTWNSAKNIPPLFIFKNNESAAYLQGQRDFMRLLLVSSPWSKKWSNTLAGWVCRILKSTICIELSKIHKALRNGFLYSWPFWCVYLTQTNLRMNQNIQNHSYTLLH